MTPVNPQTGSNAGHRFYRFIKKIFFGALILFVLSKAGTYIGMYSGWSTWGKFDTSVTKFDSVLLEEIATVSPMSLFNDLRSARTVPIIDTAARNAVDRHNQQRLQKILRREDPLGIPAQKFYPMHTNHTVTIWEKIKYWCSGFWYDDDKTANWFGRSVLFISLLVAIPLTWKSKSNHQTWASDLYVVNIVVALFYLTLFCLLFYVLMTLLLFIAGSIVALFTSVAAASGFVKYLVDELKSETLDHSKKKVVSLLD